MDGESCRLDELFTLKLLPIADFRFLSVAMNAIGWQEDYLVNKYFSLYRGGYPDLAYLDRLKSQLAQKGIKQSGEAALP